jgi:DNA polymerase-3 subunit alpha
VNKKTIEALIKTGAFDFCEHPRARLAAALDAAVERAQNVQRDRATGQSSLFDMLAGPAADEDGDDFPREALEVQEWPEQQLLANEKASLGFYVSGHPLDRFDEQIRRYTTAKVEDLGRRENFERVTLAGIVTSLRVRPFKSGDGKMAIMLFEDHTGTVEVIAMGDDFERYEALLSSDEPLLVTGAVRIDRDEDRTNISVRLGGRRRRNEEPSEGPEVFSLAEVRATRSRGLELEIATRDAAGDRLERLRDLLVDPENAGTCRAVLKLLTDDDCVVTLELPGVEVRPSDELNHAIGRLFDGRCAIHTR